MTKTIYPTVTEDNIVEVLEEIIRLRQDEDVPDFTNLSDVFVSGRKIQRTPSASNDVVSGDRENDFNWDASFLYVLIDNSGTLEWRRSTLASF